jgi:uncharacterized protein (DUF1800 family)
MTSDTSKAPAAAGVWAEYVPSKECPWTAERVIHLHRRAGWAATWGEGQRDLKDGPKVATQRLLQGKASLSKPPAEFERLTQALIDGAFATRDAGRLKAAWVYRMLFGPDALTERLVLMWHNHFATSNLKVNDLAAMQRQNDTLRKHARGKFAELLGAVVKGPALLVWLDAPANRKGHPNENLARELMELFTLGIGNYSEKDVKEAARALTGWSVEDDAFAEVAARHDDGEKTILGKKGQWKGDDLVKMLLEHPATARRLAFRLCEAFMGEGAADDRMRSALTDSLRESKLHIGGGAETVLRSQAFFALKNLRRRILPPAEYVLGAVRALELTDPAPSTLELANWITRMGQDLYYPPNVGGWPGGRSWLATRALLVRARFAASLSAPSCLGRGAPLDALGLAKKHGAGKDRDELIDFFTRLLVGLAPTAEWRKRISAPLPARATEAETARRIVTLVLATPEAQLG